MDKKEISPIILIIACGTALSCIVGFFFYGTRIFVPGMPHFQFVVSGVVGSAFYAVLKMKGLRVAITILFTLYVIDLIVLRVMRPRIFLIHFIQHAAVGVVIYAYYRFVCTMLAKVKVGKFIPLALMLAVLWVVITGVYSVIGSYHNVLQLLFTMARLHLLIGIGLGLGLEVAELLSGLTVKSHPVNK